MQVLLDQHQGGATLTLIDAQGAPLDLTSATEVRWSAVGPASIGPIVCTVTNAVGGVVNVPLDFAVAKQGRYQYEVEARWGTTTRLTASGVMDVMSIAPPVITLVNNDTPSVIVAMTGADVQAALSVQVMTGATAATATTPINGTVTVTAPDSLTIAFSAVDTAVVGKHYGRVVVDGVSTHTFVMNVVPQVIV